MDNKKIKKSLKKKFRQDEENRLLNSIPISLDDLQNLFIHLSNLNEGECDHSHSHTIEFLNSNNLDVNNMIKWLEQNGGYCDCEILYNVYSVYGKFVGWCLD
jgi:hypothetical protein